MFRFKVFIFDIIKDYKTLVQQFQDNISYLEKSVGSAISKEELELEISAVKEQTKAGYIQQMHIAQSDWNVEKASLMELVNERRDNNEMLVKEVECLKTQLDENMTGMISQENSKNEHLINFYKELSGLTILSVDTIPGVDSIISYTCHQTGSKGGMYFITKSRSCFSNSCTSKH